MSTTLSTSRGKFRAGDIIRHFKWYRLSAADKALHKYEYEYLGEVQNTEDHSVCVIYRSLFDNQLWSRPIESFYSEVDKTKYPDTMQRYRFETMTLDEAVTATTKAPCDYCENTQFCKYKDETLNCAATITMARAASDAHISATIECKHFRSHTERFANTLANTARIVY